MCKTLLISLKISVLPLKKQQFYYFQSISFGFCSFFLCVNVHFVLNRDKYSHAIQHSPVTCTWETLPALLFGSVLSLWDINNFASAFYRPLKRLTMSWLWCQTHTSRSMSRLWNHSFLNLLKSAITIKICILTLPDGHLSGRSRSPHRGALRVRYWSCPTDLYCENQHELGAQNVTQGGQHTTVLCMNWNRGHPISRLWIFKLVDFCGTTFSHCFLRRLRLHIGYLVYW